MSKFFIFVKLLILRYQFIGITLSEPHLECTFYDKQMNVKKYELKFGSVQILLVGECIYMFICWELIEENGRPPGLIFGMWRYFWPGSDKFESWKKFHTFDKVMTWLSPFWMCEKLHKCLYLTSNKR